MVTFQRCTKSTNYSEIMYKRKTKFHQHAMLLQKISTKNFSLNFLLFILQLQYDLNNQKGKKSKSCVHSFFTSDQDSQLKYKGAPGELFELNAPTREKSIKLFKWFPRDLCDDGILLFFQALQLYIFCFFFLQKQ